MSKPPENEAAARLAPNGGEEVVNSASPSNLTQRAKPVKRDGGLSKYERQWLLTKEKAEALAAQLRDFGAGARSRSRPGSSRSAASNGVSALRWLSQRSLAMSDTTLVPTISELEAELVEAIAGGVERSP